jgi:hypothetical protein
MWQDGSIPLVHQGKQWFIANVDMVTSFSRWSSCLLDTSDEVADISGYLVVKGI